MMSSVEVLALRRSDWRVFHFA